MTAHVTDPVEPRPLCKCHGEPMLCPSHWRCAVRCREYSRRRYKANPEAKRERARRWREENPDKEQAGHARRNARRLYVGGLYLGTVGFTTKEREAMLNGPTQ